MGDAIWPEENFALVIWCDEDEAQGIDRAIAKVKAQFPDEGIKLFAMRPDPAFGAPASRPAEVREPPPPEPPLMPGLSNIE
jgi:hypothetical protein